MLLFACLLKKKPIYFVKIRNSDLTKTKLKQYLLKKYLKNIDTNIILSSVVPVISKRIIDFLMINKIKFYLLKDLIKTFEIKINIKQREKNWRR
jgi:hypothetical protein